MHLREPNQQLFKEKKTRENMRDRRLPQKVLRVLWIWTRGLQESRLLSRRVSGAKQTLGSAVVVEQTHVVFGRLLIEICLDAIGHKAENGTSPQEDGEATEQLFTEFDPFWNGRGWGKHIRSISNQDFLCLFGAKALCGKETRMGRKITK